MLFDIRGRRKHVVRVVYAILALLMGASLFLVVGPFNIGNLIGNGSTTSAAKVLQEQAERTEQKLRREPERRSPAAGADPSADHRRQQPTEVNSETGATDAHAGRAPGTRTADRSLERYLKQAKEPKANTALLVCQRLLQPRRIVDEPRRSGRKHRKARPSPAHRRRSAAERQLAHHPGDLRVLRRQLRRRRQGGQGSRSQGSDQGGSERNRKTDGRIPQARQGLRRSRRRKPPKGRSESGKESLQNPLGGLGGGTGSLGE